jgi:hypothetical protein
VTLRCFRVCLPCRPVLHVDSEVRRAESGLIKAVLRRSCVSNTPPKEQSESDKDDQSRNRNHP